MAFETDERSEGGAKTMKEISAGIRGASDQMSHVADPKVDPAAESAAPGAPVQKPKTQEVGEGQEPVPATAPGPKTPEDMAGDPKEALDPEIMESMGAKDQLADAINAMIDEKLQAREAAPDPKEIGAKPSAPVTMAAADATKITERIEELKERMKKVRAEEPVRGITQVTIQAHMRWQDKVADLDQELFLLQKQLAENGLVKV